VGVGEDSGGFDMMMKRYSIISTAWSGSSSSEEEELLWEFAVHDLSDSDSEYE
jgi:hypothetical protein